jgi:hypothetical protein
MMTLLYECRMEIDMHSVSLTHRLGFCQLGVEAFPNPFLKKTASEKRQLLRAARLVQSRALGAFGTKWKV